MSDPRPDKTRAGQVYEVFAKFRKEEPLHHIGNVIAPDATLAKTYAYTLYTEVTWSEMVIAPRADIITVIEAK